MPVRSGDDVWLHNVTLLCPPGTTVTVWRDIDPFTMMQVRIWRSTKTGLTPRGGALHVGTSFTLSAKELYNSTIPEPDKYAAAQVVAVAQDMGLLLTSTYDLDAEEVQKLESQRNEVIIAHRPATCKGLTRYIECDECNHLYSDSSLGKKLQLRLLALHEKWTTEKEPERDFDPTAYDTTARYKQGGPIRSVDGYIEPGVYPPHRAGDRNYDPAEDKFLQMVERNAGKLMR